MQALVYLQVSTFDHTFYKLLLTVPFFLYLQAGGQEVSPNIVVGKDVAAF